MENKESAVGVMELVPKNVKSAELTPASGITAQTAEDKVEMNLNSSVPTLRAFLTLAFL